MRNAGCYKQHMPTRKIAEPNPWVRPCRNPEHNPPSMQVFTPGVYEHICPQCGNITTFIVREKCF